VGWPISSASARFFDAFIPAALSKGIHQAVIVGSGLDSRAYRLDWPAGTIVYEIDKPEVIEFKNSTLSGLGATPTTQLRTVVVDLRQDWPQALQQAGFDVAEPTAWLAEGLMIGYLPGQAQERLLDTITALSAPGSQLSADHLPSRSTSIGSIILDIAKGWKEQGFDVDFGTLTFAHDRSDVVARLRGRRDRHGAHTVVEKRWRPVRIAAATATLSAAVGLSAYLIGSINVPLLRGKVAKQDQPRVDFALASG
jgi:methyltransferase (TIGR00027 family)